MNIKKIGSYLLGLSVVVFLIKVWEIITFKRGQEYEKVKQMQNMLEYNEKKKKDLKEGNYINSPDNLRKRVHNKTY